MSNKIFYMRCIFIKGSFIIANDLLDDPRPVKMILYRVYMFFINCMSCAFMRVIFDGVMWII